jgi:hypothetical protein
MALRRDPLDIIFSFLVRERSDWQCERCGKVFPERKGAGLHASHYWGRAGKSTRWLGDNVFSHCMGCHTWLGSKPHEFKAWAEKLLGETRYDELTLRANKPRKYTKADRKEMKVHFTAQLEYIKRRRRQGETGYIDFVDFD